MMLTYARKDRTNAVLEYKDFDDDVEPPNLPPEIGERWEREDRPVPPVVVVPVPQAVTMRQARLALLAVGKLAAVDAAIDALPSPQKEAARIEWDFAQDIDRHWPLVALLAPAIGLDEAALDALFIDAAGR